MRFLCVFFQYLRQIRDIRTVPLWLLYSILCFPSYFFLLFVVHNNSQYGPIYSFIWCLAMNFDCQTNAKQQIKKTRNQTHVKFHFLDAHWIHMSFYVPSDPFEHQPNKLKAIKKNCILNFLGILLKQRTTHYKDTLKLIFIWLIDWFNVGNQKNKKHILKE